MRERRSLFMETTEIPAERTAAEISAEIIKAGATQIATDYKDGQILGLRWTMRVFGGDVAFSMPARVKPVYEIFAKRKGYSSSYWWKKDANGNPTDKPYDENLYAKARRVAWRQLLRWVQAQLAMIETGMVRPEEVFFAYMFDPVKDQTLFQNFETTGGFKLLETGKAQGN
jgi:hypothetical protein